MKNNSKFYKVSPSRIPGTGSRSEMALQIGLALSAVGGFAVLFYIVYSIIFNP